jgi:methylthioribulose-1-phosphate dehydratase
MRLDIEASSVRVTTVVPYTRATSPWQATEARNHGGTVARSVTMPRDLEIARRLIEVGRRFDARGWVLGTSGNFSAVVSQEPLRLAMTASGTSKGDLAIDEILEIDGGARVSDGGAGTPSAEALLHLEIVHCRGAGAVLHTHSVWSTLLSDRHGAHQGLAIEGYEMLKGLDGVKTHAHREWIPILENDQDMARLAGAARDALSRHPAAHALLLRRHGMYTWGQTLSDAVRHVEIVEFLLETVARSESSEGAAR